MTRFRKSLHDFRTDESGVLLAEALVLIPILIWGFVALIVYWDLFRVMNSSQKAAYSIADLMSRQGVVTETFVTGTQNVLDFLVPGAGDARMRITSLELDEGSDIKPEFDGDDAYVLLFSRSPGEAVLPHTTATIQDLASQIPDMNDLESVVIVETWVDYEPAFDTGVLDTAPGFAGETFYQFIVTRPRNWRRVCLAGEVPGCV
jgi:hypothetical protein